MLGIIGAMDEEVSKLKEVMDEVEITTKASMDFYKGKISGKDVVVVRSGIGKVNAGICTQILVDCYGVEAVINTGIAGSLNAAIDIGDVVLATDALQHDMDATGFGYEPGVIPRMEVSTFVADERLRTLAKECCQRVNPDIKVFEGRVVSGDQFISDKNIKNRITSQFAGYCTEMEGAAIAQAAYLNNIPFLIIRAISDKADDSATVDYPTFEAKAIENSVKLMKEMIANY
ncbi:MAG: 5'-methylthioadenosine/adenosylhomocysteine nucleosidase [Lachnospiraceae bacterium]|nr:5'-methylthioadenosine/adenosylhomocysteine nucleosidase [Lachnospiraceae bacterium]